MENPQTLHTEVVKVSDQLIKVLADARFDDQEGFAALVRVICLSERYAGTDRQDLKDKLAICIDAYYDFLNTLPEFN